MKTSELIEELKWVMDVEGEPYQEIVEKLRQLEDIKKMIGAVVDTLEATEDLWCMLFEITNFQKGDINYGRKE